jgi:uncharacterized protein
MTRANPLFSNTSYSTKFVLFISIVFVSFIICMFLGFIIALPLFGIGFSDLLKAFSQSADPQDISIMKYFQSVSQFGLFIIPAIVFSLLVSKNSKEYLQINQKTKILSIVFSCLIMIAAIPFINWLADLNLKMQFPASLAGLENWMKESENTAAKITEAFLNVSSILGLLGNLFVIAVLAAVGEELFFRGVLQRLFHDWTKNIHLAIFLSAFIFGVFHLQFYGLIPRVLMGTLFGYLLYWSGSLWLPIMAHFTNNALAVIVDFLSRKKQLNFDMDTIGTEDNALLLVLSSIIIVCALIYTFYKIEKRKVKIPISL